MDLCYHMMWAEADEVGMRRCSEHRHIFARCAGQRAAHAPQLLVKAMFWEYVKASLGADT